MAEFNQFSMYGKNFQSAEMLHKDRVDTMIDEIRSINMYNEIQDFVKKNFGEVNGVQWFEYPELNKFIYVLNEDKKIEICMVKNNKQYYGKGWKPVYDK